MTFRLAFLLLLLILLSSSDRISAQKSAVIHYQQAEGLPGNYAYQMLQDKAGYIWIGTENGLVRFNGYEFKLYTTKDGLPDNEILHLYEDDSAHLWFSPFTNAIGYIKNELVHNCDNDSLLRQIHFEVKPENILSDRFGNIFISERKRIQCIRKNGHTEIFNVKNSGFPYCVYIFRNSTGEIQMMDSSRNIFQYDDKKWNLIVQLPKLDIHFCNLSVHALGLKRALVFLQKIASQHLSIYYEWKEMDKISAIIPIAPGVLAMLKPDGCLLMDIVSLKVIDTLLPGYPVAAAMVSSDGSLWLGTHGKGIFRFIHSPVKSLELPGGPASVFFLRAQDNGVYGSLEKGRFVQATFNDCNILEQKVVKQIDPDIPVQVFRYISREKNGTWIGCADRFCRYHAIGQKPFRSTRHWAFKDIFEEDLKHLLVATSFRLLRFDKDSFEYTQTLIDKRVTSVTKLDNIIYTGMLDGLVANDSGGQFHKIFRNDHHLNIHIVKLCAGIDHVLWVANNKAELVGIKDNKLIVALDDKMGLQCNSISAIKASSKFIWVGTDNGLYVIRNKPPYWIVRHLTHNSGLNSNQINCLDVDKGKVWVGTNEGINYFNEYDIFSQSSEPRLIISNITNGHKRMAQTDDVMSLDHKALSVDFDVIDQTGGQKPLYYYRLNNDTTWIKLGNSELYFPQVPFGDFTISIKSQSPNWATKLFGQLHFYRPYPFYLRWWFIVLSLLVAIAIVMFCVRLFVRNARRKDQEKVTVQRKLLQLEQMALQGQMNPHFIFNCISAIKQYYSSGDSIKANDFVDKFSSLIRQTFEMGTQIFVSLDHEIGYLSQYLDIEKTRFNDSFDFSITKELELPATTVYVPVMLLQPLAENAVRHGVRHLSDRRGMISIVVKQKADLVEIIVTDNGIGRAKSKSFGQFLQSIVPLTSTIVNTKRIELLNQLFEHQIEYRTEDVLNEQNKVVGTRTFIAYPLSIYNLYSY